MTAGTRASSHNKRKDTGGPEEPVVGKKQKKAKSKESAARSANAPPPSPLTVADKDAPQSEEPAPTSGRASAPRGKKKGTAGKSAAGKKGSTTAAEKPTGASRGQSGEAALLDVTGNTTSALTQPHPSPSERREAEKHTSPPHQPPSQDVSHQARDDAAHPNTTSEVDKDKLIASLQARLDARDAKVRKHLHRAGGATDKSSKSKSKKIKPIKKPKGEAGNPTRGGYVLQQAMELDRGDDKQAMYTAIQDDVHRFCAKYDIDYRLGSYNQQCKEKLAKVFRATYRKHPYMTPERFPSNWATGVIVQQYINGQRKAAACKKKKAAKLAALLAGGASTAQPGDNGAASGEDSSDEDERDEEEDEDEEEDGADEDEGESSD